MMPASIRPSSEVRRRVGSGAIWSSIGPDNYIRPEQVAGPLLLQPVLRDGHDGVAHWPLGCHPMRFADVRDMPTNDDALVTIAFISAELMVSRQTAWRWVHDKKIRSTAIMVGSRTVYRIRYRAYLDFREKYVRGEED
jgi:hypothetical protein